MELSRPQLALTSLSAKKGLSLFALLASVACGSSDGEGDDDAAAAGGSASGGEAGNIGGTGGSPDVGAGGNIGGGAASGGIGNGGAGAGGVSTGGVNGGGTGAGGGASGGDNGTSAGGMDAGGSGGVGDSADAVTRTDSTFTFQHFPVETDDSDVWNGPMSPDSVATSTTYDTVVLENAYLKVTLLPSYGGRILSMLHKPTGRELLYQNPIGTPYLMLEDIFYYDYLVIMGGIFPSFPDPEHGRNWNQPYDFEVISESEEAITVRMSRLDDIDLAAGVPADYSVGRTDILAQLDVTLRAGQSSLELSTTLTNTGSGVSPEFEYWTVTTLAPGSTPGETAIPLNTRIMADMDQVRLLEDSWPWFADAEERVTGDVFQWDNLSYFENWVEQGTAFANPSYQANWSGLINYDVDMGIVRATDNMETPGLKLWTFGRDSIGVDTSDSSEWLRPTIEMWHGITPEFWMRTTMAADEVRSWSEHYFPTLGLKEITAASEYGALYLSTSQMGGATELKVAATLTLPEQTVKAVLSLDGNVVSEQEVLVVSDDATLVNFSVSTDDTGPGAIFKADFLLGESSLLSGQVAL